jgi:hypothetical protein
MRNIYDIIAEQKAVVDVNMAKYDLDYVVETFNDYDFYVQEGLGDLGRKVIAFIKSIIEKIKELIRKVINFFTGRGNREKQLNDIIEDANAGGGGSSEPADSPKPETKKDGNGKEDHKDRIKEKLKNQGVDIKDKKDEPKQKSQPKPPQKKVKNIDELLHSSKQKVKMHVWASLRQKMNFAILFINKIGESIRTCVQKDVTNTQVFTDLVIDKVFRGAGDVQGNMPIEERIRLELGEGRDDELHEYTVSVIADITLEYIRETDSAIKLLQQAERASESELNKMIQQANANGEDDKKLNIIRTAANMVAIVARVISTGIVKAYNEHNSLATRIAKEYKESQN